jgi:hypothetical protein
VIRFGIKLRTPMNAVENALGASTFKLTVFFWAVKCAYPAITPQEHRGVKRAKDESPLLSVLLLRLDMILTNQWSPLMQYH